MSRPLLGALLLLIAACIWGGAFVPQKLTVVALPPLLATAVRFALAAPLALLLAGRRLRSDAGDRRVPLALGVILLFAYATQTAALATVPVTRVSLITGLYAVFVPFLAPLFGLPRPRPLHWAGAGVALIGLLLLVGVVGGDALAVPLGVGDLLVLVHALFGALHVLVVSTAARRADPFVLNAQQLTVLLVLGAPIALLVDGTAPLAALDGRALIAFAYLAVLSTVVAFTCQIAGQRHASAPTAAVIMLLETPVGVIGAQLFFREAMAPLQWLGAAVVLCGVALSLVAELRRRPTAPGE
ncbi:MAG: hypothetical protein A2138_01815, partial [Deltaproteobacteria bacterium RBG_16_71_12]